MTERQRRSGVVNPRHAGRALNPNTRSLAPTAHPRGAQDNGRKTVSAVHKATIHKLGDGLFLECCREVAKAVRQQGSGAWGGGAGTLSTARASHLRAS